MAGILDRVKAFLKDWPNKEANMLKEFRGDILDVPTLAELMGVCNMSIYRYLKLKDPLPAHRVKGKYLFFRDEVERWLRDK